MVKSIRQSGQSIMEYIIIGVIIILIAIVIYVFFGEDIRAGMDTVSEGTINNQNSLDADVNEDEEAD